MPVSRAPAVGKPGGLGQKQRGKGRSALGTFLLIAFLIRAGGALADGTNALTRGPYLQMGTPTSMVVRWRTAAAMNSIVRCGTNQDNLSLSFANPDQTTEHEIRAAGLTPNTQYFYRIESDGQTLADGPGCFFVTSPAAGKPTRILVTSDMQTANPQLVPAFTQFAHGRPADLWLSTGDSGGDSDQAYQQNLFNPYATILQQTVLWPCMGNHDSWLGAYFLSMFTLPTQGEAGGTPSGTENYYSFDYGSIHCVVLNSVVEDVSTNGMMYAWLSADLANNDRDWLIAYWHYPPYTKGAYNSDTDPSLRAMRENFLPLLETRGVDLVLSGHNHIYERSFLIDSHYGVSSELQPQTMIKNWGDGQWEGTGPYCKPSVGPAPHQGTVYAKVASGFNYMGGSTHPVMFTMQVASGCLVLDIDGQKLEVTFLRNDGQIGDHFTILKGVRAVGPRIANFSAVAAQTTLNWKAIPQRRYRIHRSLALGSEWLPASPWLWAEGRTMSWSETNLTHTSGFYRIEIETE
jgi:hypothetical protein